MSCAELGLVLATHMFQSKRTQSTDTKTVHGMITVTRRQRRYSCCCCCWPLRKKNFNFRNVFRFFFLLSNGRVAEKTNRILGERNTLDTVADTAAATDTFSDRDTFTVTGAALSCCLAGHFSVCARQKTPSDTDG